MVFMSMSKIKISKNQYNHLLIHEQEARLQADTSVIVDESSQVPELLEESWKEVIMGVSMILGVTLTGLNKVAAQNAFQSKTIMKQIKSTLEDSTKIKELVDSLKEKGMKDPDELIARNAGKVVDDFNKIASENNISYRISQKATTTMEELGTALKNGYAIQNADIKTDVSKDTVAKETYLVKDTIEIQFDNDNIFNTGGYSLSDSGFSAIDESIDTIETSGGKIISVNIESSTDAEPYPKLKSEDDPSGNITLASLRTKHVSSYVSTLINGAPITHREIPNNGSDVVSSKEFSKAKHNHHDLLNLRDKSAQYRYVKIKIIAEFQVEAPENKPAPEHAIKEYRFNLVKLIKITGKKHGVRIKVKLPHLKFKCKVGRISPHKCFTF